MLNSIIVSGATKEDVCCFYFSGKKKEKKRKKKKVKQPKLFCLLKTTAGSIWIYYIS